MNEAIDQISMVIPTRNRKDSLFRLLDSVVKQSTIPFEVIIVDSSDEALHQGELQSRYETLNIILIHSAPSVCKQRNQGIERSKGTYVFICDDDNELEQQYVELVCRALQQNDRIQIASGIALTKDRHGTWVSEYPTSGNFALRWRKFFHLGVWENVNQKQGVSPSIKHYYQQKGNDITKAGWPINTQWNDELIICTVYGLGASIARKSYWLDHPYDEVLDAHGLGDNYGIVMNEVGSIGVVKAIHHLHHQSPLNRQKQNKSYEQRVYALHYFLKTGKRFKAAHRRCLIWSLTGNFLSALLGKQFSMAGKNMKLITKLILGVNPYLKKKV